MYLLYISTYSIYHFPSNTSNLFFYSYNTVGFPRVNDHVKQSEAKTPPGANSIWKTFSAVKSDISIKSLIKWQSAAWAHKSC